MQPIWPPESPMFFGIWPSGVLKWVDFGVDQASKRLCRLFSQPFVPVLALPDSVRLRASFDLKNQINVMSSHSWTWLRIHEYRRAHH